VAVEWLRLALRYLHLVGFALLIGGWAVQFLASRTQVSLPMRIGLGAMIGTGLLLSIPFPAGVDLDYVKLGVKLVIALGVGALFGVVETRAKAGKTVSRGLFGSVGALALVNAAVAVFWH
jgi:hypothetical protein